MRDPCTAKEAVTKFSSLGVKKVILHLFFDCRRDIIFFLLNRDLGDDLTDEGAANVETRATITKDYTVMCTLARWYLEYNNNQSKASALFRQAAELGDRVAQYYHGLLSYTEDNPMRYTWWKKALERKLYGEDQLTKTFFGQITTWLCKGGIADNILYEMGGALKIHLDTIKSITTENEELAAVQNAISFHNQCFDKSQLAIQHWLAIGKRFLVKDVTIMIARILESDRSAWSDNSKKGKPQRQRRKTVGVKK